MEELNKHTYIEFRLGKTRNTDKPLLENNWRNLLWEEHGIIPNMDSYTDAISDLVNERLSQWDGKETPITVPISRNDFHFNTFFNEIQSTIFITLTNEEGKNESRGIYSPSRSGINDGQYVVSIPVVFIEGTPQTVLNKCRKVFAHELTHAYDDYRRKMTGKEPLNITARKRGLTKTNAILYDEQGNDNVRRNMAWFLYFIEQSEVNAHIGEMREELKPLMGNVTNSQQAMQAFRKTSLYKNLLAAQQTMDTIEYFNENDILLDVFNSTRRKDEADKLCGIETDTPTDYQAMKSIVKLKFLKTKGRIMRQVPKILYDLYSTYGDHGLS